MKDINFLLKALIKKLEGEIEVAKANIKVYERQSVGIGEHIDIVETIEKEVRIIADYDDLLQMINKYFEKSGTESYVKK